MPDKKKGLSVWSTLSLALALTSVGGTTADTCYSVEQHYPKRCKEVTCVESLLSTQEQFETYDKCCGTGAHGGVTWEKEVNGISA